MRNSQLQKILGIIGMIILLITFTACEDDDGGVDLNPKGEQNDTTEFNVSAWYGTFYTENESGAYVTITPHSQTNNINFKFTDWAGDDGLAGYIELINDDDAEDETFQLHLSGDRLLFTALTEYGEEWQGVYERGADKQTAGQAAKDMSVWYGTYYSDNYSSAEGNITLSESVLDNAIDYEISLDEGGYISGTLRFTDEEQAEDDYFIILFGQDFVTVEGKNDDDDELYGGTYNK